MATTMAIASPHSRTTNTPPIVEVSPVYIDNFPTSKRDETDKKASRCGSEERRVGQQTIQVTSTEKKRVGERVAQRQ
jgi:hypothetical protein